MKIRDGFVSNSSSSSFVIITTEEKWKEAKLKLAEKLGENVAAVILSEYRNPDKVRVLGQDALVLSGILSSEDFGCRGVETLLDKGVKLSEDDQDDLLMKAYEEHYNLLKILDSDGVSYTTNECC